jgi:two-component system sensor histidine kinase AtoS
VAPFQRVARLAFAALLGVSCIVILLCAMLAARLTQSLRTLAEAASAVAAGDFERSVNATGPQEIAKLSSAFNVMTGNLRNTLAQLSERQALAAVGEFAASLSHEVRNGLMSVRVDLQRAHEKVDPDTQIGSIIDRALGNTERLNSAVSSALRLTRNARTNDSIVDARDLVGRAVAGVSVAMEARSGTLHTVTDPGGPLLLRGDSVALEQMLLNVLLNAAQAIDRRGNVWLSCERAEGDITLRIADDGLGITQENLGFISKPFFSTKHEGTGLGLSIASRIAAAHQGTLTIESGTLTQASERFSPHIRTCVTILLPAATT